jgi:hypothetical protein
VDERAVVEHRDVEALAVPRHELRALALDRVEEAADHGLFVAFGLADREHFHAFVVARDARDHHHALQVRRQEVVAGLHAALLERDLGDVLVGQVLRQLVHAPDAGDVGHRLDIEGEDRGHEKGVRTIFRESWKEVRTFRENCSDPFFDFNRGRPRLSGSDRRGRR